MLVVVHRAGLDYESPQFQPVLDHWETHRMQPVWHGNQDGFKVLLSASIDYPEMLSEMREAVESWPTEASFRFRDLLWSALGREKP